MSKRLAFKMERVVSSATMDKAWIPDGVEGSSSAIASELLRQAWDNLKVDIEITVGDVTMHAAAWEDPDHWATDWATKLGVDVDDVPGEVAALLLAAVTDT